MFDDMNNNFYPPRQNAPENTAQASADNNNLVGHARIKVIGVGGAGNNAVNRMIEAEINCAEYYVVNTDVQILALSPCKNKIQIGISLTKGLGAGAEPEVGRAAAEESKEALTEAVKDTDLLFITAGMGGGTGTGAAPVIAKIARDMKILTVGVVTEPFAFEGKTRFDNTVKGLENLKKYVDTLIIIPNDKIRTVVPKNTPVKDAFRVADEVLKQGIKGIAELIINPALINLDFADVKTILKDTGIAHMGVGVAKGENRIIEAVRLAINSPLLETKIEGARGVILNIVGGEDLTFDEINNAAELVRSVVDASANIIFGARIDPNVRDEVEITVIATGFIGYDSTSKSTSKNYGVNYMQQPAQGVLPVNNAYAAQQPQPAQRQPVQQPKPATQANYAQQPVAQAQYVQQPVSQAQQQYQQQAYVQQPVSQQYQQAQYAQQPTAQAQQYQQQQPQYTQQVQYAGQSADQQGIERPAEKDVPKFAQLLKNLNKKD